MRQIGIPYYCFRGGTSRGLYFRRSDLPNDVTILAQVLKAALGSGHALNIDGLGGGAAVTTKVAILSPSTDDWAEVDYLFAQVSVLEGQVDFKPTCGNILAGIGPAAVEMGLVRAQAPQTRVKIRAVNTGARIEAVLSTPEGEVDYDGTAKIDGVPGTAAPILLNFKDVTGSATGSLLPTGRPVDCFEDLSVTCVDVAIPIVAARAEDFGLTGYETPVQIDTNQAFYQKMEAIRRQAGRAMGLGDVAQSVLPKFVLLAAPRHGGSISARYLMPKNCHPAMAVTGAQAISACCLLPGSVAEGLGRSFEPGLAEMVVEHPSGNLAVTVDFERDENSIKVKSAGILRTSRLLASGMVMIPASAFRLAGTAA